MECKCLVVLVMCGLAASAVKHGDHALRLKRSSDSQRKKWRLTADANKLFAHRLYAHVARDHQHGNLMISPYVVSSAMSMMLLGARDHTEHEIMNTLGYTSIGIKKNGDPYTKYDVPKLYQEVAAKAKSSGSHNGCQLVVANKLYGDQSESFLPEFIGDTERYFDAKFEQVDFVRDPEGAREVMNEWIRNRTNGVIEEGVPPAAVSSSTLLSLVSTAFFKGEWKDKFSPELTYTGDFTKRDGTIVKTRFMKKKLKVKYGFSRRLESEILILPYKTQQSPWSTQNSDYAIEMQLFLPRDSNRLLIIEQLREANFHQALRRVRLQQLEIHLPKFVMEFELNLADTLYALGARSLFGSPNLSGMNGKRNLKLTSAFHKSFMEVNEEGTTAGAVAVFGSNRRAGPATVHFDHPFVFIIVEKTTNSILFMGRLDQPSSPTPAK